MQAALPFFIPFKAKTDLINDQVFILMKDEPHPLCVLVAEELQNHILNQQDWQHNFGLTSDGKGMVIGKMFGVLIVRNQSGEIGYLAAFSGKLAGSNHHEKFVPPVFDTLSENGFLTKGMEYLAQLTKQLKNFQEINPEDREQIKQLKTIRKDHSVSLQNRIFASYHFLNGAGEEKSLTDIFLTAGYKNPPAGAGECAGPKLLQYAFQHQMKPIALAEFWWGQSPKSATWKHKEFYACCKEKCEPILAHMLSKTITLVK